jgi:hypothetical protein
MFGGSAGSGSTARSIWDLSPLLEGQPPPQPNPTLTPRIAFSTWHSGGLQAVSIRRPKQPSQLAEFMPEPLDTVALEDLRLSSDADAGHGERVVMWSYPIIKDGLIYVVDYATGCTSWTMTAPSTRRSSGSRSSKANSTNGTHSA